MSKLVQLELELEEMQQRVSKLEELFTELAKWTDFNKPQIELIDEEISLDNDELEVEILETESITEKSVKSVPPDTPPPLILPAKEDDFRDCEDDQEFYKIEIEDEKCEPGESEDDSTLSKSEEFLGKAELPEHTNKTRSVTTAFEPLQLPHPSSLPAPPHVIMENMDSQLLQKVKVTPVFKCRHCPFVSKTRISRDQHYKNQHSTECYFCQRTCGGDKGLQKHMQRHTREYSFKIVAEIKCRLDNHIIQNHKKLHSKFQCYFCKKSYGCSRYFRKHMQSHTQEYSYKCPHCKYYAKFNSTLNNHLIRKHQMKPFACRLCQETFNLRRERQIHRKENQCRNCPCKFKKFDNLIKHARTHTGERPFKCPHCSYASARTCSMKEHIRRIHSKFNEERTVGSQPTEKYRFKRNLVNNQFQCYFCEKSYQSRQYLDRHILTHIKEHPYKCPHCKYYTKFNSTLNNHFVQKHQIKPFACTFCQDTFQLKKQLHDHKLKIHGEEMQCPHCKYKQKDPYIFNIHLRTHTGERPFKCPHCAYAGASYATWRSHIKCVHPVNEERTFACNQCPGEFTSKNYLNQHIKRRHTKVERNFLCHHCPYAVSSDHKLRRHIKLLHSVLKEEDYFKCYFCLKKFRGCNTLLTHMRSHTGECPFKCSQCPFSADGTRKLINHVRVAHNSDQAERYFKCSKCHDVFKFKRDFENHSKLHGKTGFQCANCAGKFLSSTMLLQHMNYEHPKGKKDFQCPHCPKMFTAALNLKYHINSHTGNRPYKCPHCSYASTSMGTTKRHIRSLHASNEERTVVISRKQFLKRFTNNRVHNQFQCYFCKSSFSRNRDLRRHFQKHTTEHPFKCPHCKYAAKLNSTLNGHLASKHQIEIGPFAGGFGKKKFNAKKKLQDHKLKIHVGENRCPHCPSTVSSYHNLRRHIKLVHSVLKEEDYFKCYFCLKKFRGCNTLLTHMRSHTGECPFKCSHCPFSADGTRKLINHVRVAHNSDQTGSNFKCSKCHDVFKFQRDFENHSKLHGKTGFKCAKCAGKFLSSTMLQQHMNLEHPKGKKDFQCPHCPKMFTAALNLKYHINSHTGNRPYKCPHCSYASTSMGTTKRHIRSIHTSKAEQTFACDQRPGKFIFKNNRVNNQFQCYFCQLSYSKKSDLNGHIQKHTTEHCYKCPHCKYYAKCNSTLNNHLVQKHQIKPFTCGVCQETFKLHKQLYDHRLKIHGTKEKQCPHCTYKCKKFSSLVLHLRTHTGERPSKCPHCSYAGASNSRVKWHIRNIHSSNEDRPFACSQCPGKFRFKRILNNHVKRRHNKLEKNFLCHHCPFTTAERGAFNKHIKLVHSVFKEEDYFKCYFCFKKLKAQGLFLQHMRFHTGECPFKCPVCPFSADGTIKLNNHAKLAHTSDQTGRNFKCIKCPAAFKYKRDFEVHSKLHGKSAYKCTMCDVKGFLSSTILKKHVQDKHPTGGKHHKCPHCPKMFKEACLLKWHVNTHTGNKPFKCPNCSYSGPTPVGLDKHLKRCKTLLNGRGIACEECGQRFTNEKNVNIHKGKSHPKRGKNFGDAEKLQLNIEKSSLSGNTEELVMPIEEQNIPSNSTEVPDEELRTEGSENQEKIPTLVLVGSPNSI